MAPSSAQARANAHRQWAMCPDRSARTANGTAAFLARFEAQVDPEGLLDPAERAKRAENAKRAYMTDLALKSARSRRKNVGVVPGDSPAPSPLAERGNFSGEAA